MFCTFREKVDVCFSYSNSFVSFPWSVRHPASGVNMNKIVSKDKVDSNQSQFVVSKQVLAKQ